VADTGYACVVLLDTWLLLSRPDLRSVEEALRRWWAAAALARPAGAGGRVVAVGDPADPALQALLRWDPAGFARRELEERASAHLPPASRLATVAGPPEELQAGLAGLELPPGAETLGPVPVPVTRTTANPGGLPERLERVVLRVPRTDGARLSRALVEMQGVRAARKLPTLRVQVDPLTLE
jgi:primosomal protein N' (replication factor Y)